MGTYEKACVPWSEKTTPWDFGHELLEPDLDRIAPSLKWVLNISPHSKMLVSAASLMVHLHSRLMAIHLLVRSEA